MVLRGRSAPVAIALDKLLAADEPVILPPAQGEAEALFMSCTNLRVLDLIAPLEADMEVFFRHNFRTLRNTSQGNFLDWCGLSIPNGEDADGMPSGLMISATHGRDRALLSAGLALETIIRGRPGHG